MLKYQAVEIFTSEEARHQGRPVPEAVLQYVRDLKIAARGMVTRGTDGCYENGELTTRRLEVLSYNLPVRIYLVVPQADLERVLAGITEMVTDGIVALHDLRVVSHRSRGSFFPRHFRVREAMTPDPRRVGPDTPADEVTRLLLSSVFTGLPVVDQTGRPIGLITQGDLLRRAGLPLRLGLLAETDPGEREAVLARAARRRAFEIMTSPVVTVGQDQLLTAAVELMIGREVKRLPVVDGDGRLTGMLSRFDVFGLVTREAPDWESFRGQKVEVAEPRRVADVVRRDTRAVRPETPLEEVLRIIDHDDLQRVAVVDEDGRFKGLIFDRDLLKYLPPAPEGLRGLLARARRALRGGDDPGNLATATAGQVLTADLITVGEETSLDEAIRIMTEKSIKRLPVVDGQGRFLGLVSRDSLLRTGFGPAKG